MQYELKASKSVPAFSLCPLFKHKKHMKLIFTKKIMNKNKLSLANKMSGDWFQIDLAFVCGPKNDATND